MKTRCIYCKKEGTSKEHAFPEVLLHKCAPLGKYAPNWIIRQVCKDCNSVLGELDELLATKSSMAFIWRAIRYEWESNKTDKKSKSQASDFYSARAHGMDPVRAFAPDSSYGNLMFIHEETGTSVPGFQPTPVVMRAQVPQMVLIQLTEGQTREEVIAENYEKWLADELIITKSDEHEGVYCISGNTYVFPPKATRDFISSLDKVQEFESKFLQEHDHVQYDLNILRPDEGKDLDKIEAFYEHLSATSKELIEGEHFGQKEFIPKIMVMPDQKAKLCFDRAVAKTAFHCFLYHYRQFSGHEPIFNDIKAFIEGKADSPEETGKQFVAEIGVTEDYVWPSDEHFHILRFYIKGDNIVCQIAFFTGLLVGPYASGITLAGDRDKAIQGTLQQVDMPFYVDKESQWKKTIISIKSRIVVPMRRIIIP